MLTAPARHEGVRRSMSPERAPFTRQKIGGQDYLVQIWTYDQWAMLTTAERNQLGSAQHYAGVGYVLLKADRSTPSSGTTARSFSVVN